MRGRRIDTQQAYDGLYSDYSARKAAYRDAYDLRKFELDLYWRRAAYFWAFATVVFAGYFSVLTADELTPESRDKYLLLIATLGFCLSWGWFLAVRGGKYWSSNWELHVDYLEQSGVGPLFTTVIDKDCLAWWKPFKAYPHSVGKINQATGFLIALVWIGLVGHRSLHLLCPGQVDLTPWLWVIPVGGAVYAYAVWRWAATDFGSREPGRQWFVARQPVCPADTTHGRKPIDEGTTENASS